MSTIAPFPTLHMVPSLEANRSEFHQRVQLQKTGVSGLLCIIVCMIHSGIFIELETCDRRIDDRHTDRYMAHSIHHVVETVVS